jgi:hypothetical protein
MLVRLYTSTSADDALAACAARGVTIRRALSPERLAVAGWVRTQFYEKAVGAIAIPGSTPGIYAGMVG